MKTLQDLLHFRAWVICLLILVAGSVVSPVQAETPSASTRLAEVEGFLDELITDQLETWQIPGAAVAIVEDGQLRVVRGYGYANLERLEPVDGERTLFRTGSVGKVVTWTAVMQLVEQGQLELHRDVNEYLDFTIPATFPEPITLAHLMSHTSGFEDVGEALFVKSATEMMTLEAYLKELQPARVFPPGAVNAYSNYGSALAGYIVERAAGESFDRYVENHIFVPLEMTHSTLRQPVPAELARNLATGYGAGEYHTLPGDFLFMPPYPAGAMSASAADMARFMMAHLQDGRYKESAILQPATMQMMHRRLYTPDPRLDGLAHGLMEQHVNGHHVLYHRGSTFQFNTGLFLLPEENVGLYVAYNGLGALDAPAQLWQAFMDRYYPAPVAPVEPLQDTAIRLAAYSGEYHLARADFSGEGKVIRLLEAAHVSASPEGQLLLMVEGKTEAYSEVEPALFRHHERDEWLAFHRDNDGTLWLSLDGRPAFVNFTATSAFQAPWYATLSFSTLLILPTLLLLLLSGLGWLIGALRKSNNSTPLPFSLRRGRWLAATFGLLFLLFLLALVGVLGNMDPAFGVPQLLFGTPPIVKVILMLPWVLAMVAVGLASSTGVLWLNGARQEGRQITLWHRLHHTLIAMLAWAIIWWLWYWNLLPLPSIAPAIP